MKRKASILARSMILTFLLTLLLGSLVVYAEEGVRINHKKYTVNLGDGDNVLRLEMLNQQEGDKKPRWISYNVNVATVDQNGYVTPLRKGTAVISSGIGFPRKTCTVTVVDPSVKLNKSAATLYCSNNDTTPGDTIKLTAKVKGATNKATDVVWSSSNESVAKVGPDTEGKGVVKSVGAGTAVITARANGRTASCKVTVLDSAISLNVDKMQLSTKGAGSSIKLVPTVVGSKKAVTWTSSDRNVATVNKGKVTGKAAGTATVTATANGVSTTCAVTVAGEQISISEEKVLLYVTGSTGEKKVLKSNAARRDDVTWTSSDENVVTVKGKTKNKGKEKVGEITAVGKGTAVITATCNGNTDTCWVEVKETDTSIVEADVHLKTKGEAKTYTLNYNVVGRNKAVWTSSNKKVVSVSKGKITGKKVGSAIVTVKANGIEDKVRVIVTNTPTIALNQKEYTLYTTGKGNTVTLKATINGTSKKTTWKSNNSKVAVVDTKGKVTAKGEGSALITATANGVTAKCWVNVREPKIILEKNALAIKVGERKNLRDYASMEITGAKQSVTYKSSNTKKVTVDKKGLVTGKKEGKATITIKANGAEEKFEVVVSKCETHTWGAEQVVRGASCEESGLSSRECEVCHGKEQTVTEPLGHEFGEWTVAVKATENAAGLKKQVCTRKGCNAENTRTIPPKNKVESAYGYQLMWEDDFDGEELDRESWNVELRDPGWVNAELQEYVDSPDNIYVKDGNLVIQAIKKQAEDEAGDPKVDEEGNPVYEYTSGRINTKDKHDYMYGKFEVRAKVPSGKGFLPAFWMMPTDEGYYGQWPKCGEIDIMEVMGQETKKLYSTLHFGEPHTEQQGTYTLSKGDFSKDFHVYACEWDPDEFRFYVDGKLFYTVNDWFTQRPGFGKVAYPAPYDQDFYMILNLAVGGSWVTNPDESTKFESNARLVVDYVRVYQKDEYDTNVEKPDNDVQLREPDESGNYIINGDFAKKETMPTGKNWELLEANGGKAAAEIKDNWLHITTTNAGTVSYSVQVIQADLPIENGCKYKLSYDAYADEPRKMITNVTAPDRGYARYLEDTTVNLTTESQHFEHTFEMKSDSDANGRVEFNLGKQEPAAKVHITNVRLEKDGAAAEDVKGMLPDGNYVYNGSFDEGNEDGRLRLAYWDWDIDKCEGASVSVTRDAKRELKVVVPETVSALGDVVVSQKSIAIKGEKTYVLSFDAYADQEKTIEAAIAGKTFESTLTTEQKEYRYEFKTTEGLSGSELRFLLGNAGTTYIDNVCVREDGLIVNGDFSSNMTGFEVYVHDAATVSGYIVDSLNDEKNPAFSIDIEDTGAGYDHYIQLKQNNIKLEKGQWYELGFDAKSTLDRQIKYALQRDGSKHDDDWTQYSKTPVVDLTKDYQRFSHKFMMAEDTDPAAVLSITMGAVGGTQITKPHTITIDNITLEKTDPEEIPPVEEGTEMIKNGDFANGDEYWAAEIGGGAADVSFTGEKATYQITDVGSNDWDIKLKHTEKLTLEEGASYKVSFKITSTAARTVKYSFMTSGNDWYCGEDLSLAANEVKEVDAALKVEKATSDDITFAISMGKIEGEDTPASTIVIDDISVKKISGSGGEEPVKPVTPVEPGKEMITNGTFAEVTDDGKEATGWENAISSPAEARVSFAGGKATYEINNVGEENHHIQLKHKAALTLEKGAKYKVKFKIKSTEARTVTYVFQDAGYGWYGGQDLTLEKDKELDVDYEMNVIAEDNDEITFLISMGKACIYKDETPEYLETAISTIEISDISVKKVGNEGGEGDDESGDEGDTGDEQDGENLIKNGNFEDWDENWNAGFYSSEGEDKEKPQGKADLTHGKARYEITNAGAEGWNVQLKQEGLAMETGETYKVNFKIGSSIDRDVTLEFQDNGYQGHGNATINLKANMLKAVSQIVELDDGAFTGTLAFQLSMGQIGNTPLKSHAIEISDISVTKVAAGATADEETETDVKIAPPADNMIQNGDFAEGINGWEEYIHTAGGAEATSTFTGKKARYEIANVGTDNWNVQLKQSGLTMEKGAKYKVNFKIASTIDRTVEFAFQDTNDGWYDGGTIDLTANMKKSVSRVVTITCDGEVNGLLRFQLSMGKIGGKELESHAIEISDISVTKVDDGTAADKETEKDYTISPPTTSGSEARAKSNAEAKTTPSTNDSDDKVGDDSDDAVEDDDQNPDDSDDDSDDTADDEDADTADDGTDPDEQDKSDGSKDGKDAETSDGQSDSTSNDAPETSGASGTGQTSKDAGSDGMKQTSDN